MKKHVTFLLVAFALISTNVDSQVVIRNDTFFNTSHQMLLANELFKSGEPFAEALGYNLDNLDPMIPNSPDSIAYTTGIEGYEYSRYLLGTVISRSGIGLHMMWSPMVSQMAAMEDSNFDGSFTGGMANGFKEDDELMMMVGHFGMLANQMAPMNPFPEFAEFESGNPQLPQAVSPNFAMDFSSLRWDRNKMNKTLNMAGMGQTLWKQYYWAKDMLGAFHDSLDNTIDANGIVTPDSVGSPNFDPSNNVYYGGNSVDGFIGQVLTAESINKVMFLLNNLAYDGNTLGMVDPATYDPANGIKYFPTKIAVNEQIVNPMLPPKANSFTVIDPTSKLFDQTSLLLGTVGFKNMMDPSINDAEHYAYHEVFDGDPFPAAMSQTGMMGPYDMMAGASMVLFKNIMAMHYNMTQGTFVDNSDLSAGNVVMGNTISAKNAAYLIIAFTELSKEFAGSQMDSMARAAINAQANFIISNLKDANGGYYNSFTIGYGHDNLPKTLETQASIAQALYVAADYLSNSTYLNAADDAYNFMITELYDHNMHAFRTEAGNNLATYTPEILATLAGGLREATLIGNHSEAAIIFTRVFKNIFNSMLMAEAEPSGETGNDSDGDGIPYIVGGYVPTVFVAEAEFSITTAGVNDLSQNNEGSLKIYPNPVRNEATIIYKTTTPDENIILTIIDIVGKEFENVALDNHISGQHEIKWNASNLQNGVYIVKISNNTGLLEMKKIIVNR